MSPFSLDDLRVTYYIQIGMKYWSLNRDIAIQSISRLFHP